MANLINKDTIEQERAKNPFRGMSKEELDRIIPVLEQKTREEKMQSSPLSIGRGLSTARDIFLQAGGIKPADTMTGLNEYIMKAMVEDYIKSQTPEGKLARKKALFELGQEGETPEKPIPSPIIPAPSPEPTPITSTKTTLTETPPSQFIRKPSEKYPGFEIVENPDYVMWQKEQEAKIKDKVGAEKGVSGTKNFIRSFSESRQELLDAGFKNIGEANIGGFTTRLGARLTEKTGVLPKTTKFLNRMKVIANQSARDVEGGRVTDQDRQVYADAMANAIKFPDATNIGLASEALVDLKNRGGNIEPVLKEFENSGMDLFMSIAKEARRLSGGIREGTIPTQAGQEAIDIYID